MRRSLECIAVADAAVIRTDANMEDLFGIIHEMQEALIEGNNQKFFELDDSFHTYIMQLHGNKLMLDSLYRVHDQQQRIRYLSVISPYERMRNTILEHREIINMIQEKNQGGAVVTMTRHLHNAQSELGEILDGAHPILDAGVLQT
jgi:DNA-binding GntR family transcriptional regulator